MKIVTFTPNPAIDGFARADEIAPGRISRLSEERSFPGGKGVNVSRTVLAFGGRTSCLAAEGGLAGQELLGLLRRFGVPFSAYRTACETRRNFIFEDGQGRRYKMNSPGGRVEPEEQAKMAEWAMLHCARGDAFHTGGSLLEGMTAGFYERVSRLAEEKGLHLALDPAAVHERDCLSLRCRFLKANLFEMAEVLGKKAPTLEDALESGILRSVPERETIVSGGAEGAVLLHEGRAYRNFVKKRAEGLQCGCGDSLFAVYVMRRMAGDSPARAFNAAGAAGLACAFSDPYVLASPETAKRMLVHVETKEV